MPEILTDQTGLAALLFVIVIGLSQWVKTKARLQDRYAEVVSAVIGLLLGASAELWLIGSPSTSDALPVILAALAFALVPSGLYKFGGAIAGKVGG